jgi:hypothetical protein
MDDPVTNNPDQVIITFSEFLPGAVTNQSFEEVASEIAKEQKDTVRIDSSCRRDEEWAVLANQVVGRENLQFVQ